VFQPKYAAYLNLIEPRWKILRTGAQGPTLRDMGGAQHEISHRINDYALGSTAGREQHVHAVEQLDVGADGYLVSRMALLHPQGETFDVSMGLQGLVQSLTKIAAQPEKDFGELVRRRRRKRGLSVAPAGKILPFLQAHRSDDPAKRAALDAAAERLLWSEGHGDEMHEARVRLAERRLHETLLVLDQAEVVDAPAWKRGGLEDAYVQEMKAYERLLRRDDGSSKACE